MFTVPVQRFLSLLFCSLSPFVPSLFAHISMINLVSTYPNCFWIWWCSSKVNVNVASKASNNMPRNKTEIQCLALERFSVRRMRTAFHAAVNHSRSSLEITVTPRGVQKGSFLVHSVLYSYSVFFTIKVEGSSKRSPRAVVLLKKVVKWDLFGKKFLYVEHETKRT